MDFCVVEVHLVILIVIGLLLLGLRIHDIYFTNIYIYINIYILVKYIYSIGTVKIYNKSSTITTVSNIYN